jgi:hypothetical protein
MLAGFVLGLLSPVVVAQTAPPTSSAALDYALIDTQHQIPAMPPPTRKHDDTETYFGTTVHDP